MTITRPRRRITLQFSQIFLTLGRTFTCCSVHGSHSWWAPGLCAMDQIAWSGRSSSVCEPPGWRLRTRSVALGLRAETRGAVTRPMCLLVAVGDAPSGEVVRSELNLDLVTRENSDVVATHLSGDVSQNGVTILEFDPEHGVREGLDDGAFQHDGIFFGLCDDRLSLFLQLAFAGWSWPTGRERATDQLPRLDAP